MQSDAIEPASIRKNVLVIGGGPAGVEAAYVAHMRGHKVVLCEKGTELGGMLRLAAVPVGKQELCRVIKFMVRRLINAGVEIRTGCEVTADMIAAEFDGYEIICASGAVPKEIAAYKCFRQTMTAGDVLSGKGFPGRKVVIPGGGSVGCETADYLAPLIDDRFPANRDVTIIELTNTLMATEGGAAKSMLTQRLMRKGVHILSECMVTKVDETTITYEKNGQEYVIADADTLIFAVGYTPLPVAYEPVRLIGDCEKAGNLKDAISAAYTYARNL